MAHATRPLLAGDIEKMDETEPLRNEFRVARTSNSNRNVISSTRALLGHTGPVTDARCVWRLSFVSCPTLVSFSRSHSNRCVHLQWEQKIGLRLFFHDLFNSLAQKSGVLLWKSGVEFFLNHFLYPFAFSSVEMSVRRAENSWLE